jgi:hypothetical protein
LFAVGSVFDAQPNEFQHVHELTCCATSAIKVGTSTTLRLDNRKARSRWYLPYGGHRIDRYPWTGSEVGMDQCARQVFRSEYTRNRRSANLHLSNASEYSSAWPGPVPDLRDGTGAGS